MDVFKSQSALSLVGLLLAFVETGVVARKVPGHHETFQIFVLNCTRISLDLSEGEIYSKSTYLEIEALQALACYQLRTLGLGQLQEVVPFQWAAVVLERQTVGAEDSQYGPYAHGYILHTCDAEPVAVPSSSVSASIETSPAASSPATRAPPSSARPASSACLKTSSTFSPFA